MSAAGEAKPNRGPEGAALRESQLPTRLRVIAPGSARRQQR